MKKSAACPLFLLVVTGCAQQPSAPPAAANAPTAAEVLEKSAPSDWRALARRRAAIAEA